MDFDSLYLKALKYLNYRPRSEKEIRDYLLRHSGKQGTKRSQNQKNEGSWPNLSTLSSRPKGQDDTTLESGVIDLIIHKLKEQKFLNDIEFAKMWVRSRTSYKPKGKFVIVQELKQKGISQDIIDEIWQDDEVRLQSEVEGAVEILEKKRKKYEGMEYQERFSKAGSMLARRGFDLDTIRQAMDKVFEK